MSDLKLGYLHGVLCIEQAELQPLSKETNVISDKPQHPGDLHDFRRLVRDRLLHFAGVSSWPKNGAFLT